MIINRREFISLTGVAAAASTLPALAPLVREPYVLEKEWVDSIVWHLWDDLRNPAPTGPLFVSEVKPWDGKGYPITLAKTGWHKDREFFDGWYDFEWVNLRRELPANFWHHHSASIYPNVHSYIREQRFGEPPSVMRARMVFNNSNPLPVQQASKRFAA